MPRHPPERHDDRRGLEDLPRLLDCMYQVLWWLACVWVPQVIDDSCQSFQGFDQAHGDLCNWHHWQRSFLYEHLQFCLGLHHVLLRLFGPLLGLPQCWHRLLSRFDSATKSGPRWVHLLSRRLTLFHRRLLLLHLVLQDAKARFGHRRCSGLCQLLPGQRKSLGRSLRFVGRVGCLPRVTSTLLWPSHSMSPSTCRSHGTCPCRGTTGSCTLRIATLEHAVQIELSIAADASEQKATQKGMHPKPLSLSQSLSLFERALKGPEHSHVDRTPKLDKERITRSQCNAELRPHEETNKCRLCKTPNLGTC